MWEGAPWSEVISPSARDASTAAVEEVVAWEASTSSVEEGTSSGDDVDKNSGSSSSRSNLYSSSSIKMRSSISLSPAHSKISWGQGAVSLKVTSHDSIIMLVSKVKHSIKSTMRGISKQNVIRRMRLKFVKIIMLQDKALATKRPVIKDRWLASKVKLNGGQI
jgi:hypothetical protein